MKIVKLPTGTFIEVETPDGKTLIKPENITDIYSISASPKHNLPERTGIKTTLLHISTNTYEEIVELMSEEVKDAYYYWKENAKEVQKQFNVTAKELAIALMLFSYGAEDGEHDIHCLLGWAHHHELIGKFMEENNVKRSNSDRVT